jgi:hypothetical protein
MLCGSVISPSVRDVLLNTTSQWEGAVPPTEDPIFWLRPKQSHWGAGPAFHSIFEAIAKRTVADEGLVLLCREGEEKDPPAVTKRGRIDWVPGFRSIGRIDGISIPGALEVIMNPGRWVLALVHRADRSSNLTVGTGFCSAAPGVVQALERGFLDMLRGARNARWCNRPELATGDPITVLKRTLRSD